MKSQIIYIHGYGSSGQSSTAEKLRVHFPNLISPTYDPLDPHTSLNELTNLVGQFQRNNTDVILVSSSLGGWYAEQISKKMKVASIFYNPSIFPHKTLSKYNLDESIIEDYNVLSEDHKDLNQANSIKHIIVCMDDEIVDPTSAISYFYDHSYIFTKGGHRFCDSNMPLLVESILTAEDSLVNEHCYI